jgi:succinoglycan biosynthesis transport protein ExoP
MELRQLLGFLRRWFFLLILGAVIGGIAAYWASISQPLVYQASTKVMVMQPSESLASDLTNISDIQLAETFRSLLITKPVLDAASERVGVPIDSEQISSKLIQGTSLLEVTARNGDPLKAALIANALVESLIEQNEMLQEGRFSLSEESLQAQLAQVEAQISALREDEDLSLDLLSAEDREARRQGLESDILAYTNQISEIESEIENLAPEVTPDLELLAQQTELLVQKQARLTLLKISSELAVSRYQELLPWAAEGQIQAAEEEILDITSQISALESEIELLNTNSPPPLTVSVEQDGLNALLVEKTLLQLNLDIANERYREFILTNESGNSSVNRSAQDDSNLALYEQIYSNLLSNYEAVRLARIQSSPSIVQVERATPPVVSLNTNSFTNMILGVAAGMLVMGGIGLLVEYLDDTLKTPEEITEILGLPVIGYVDDVSELKRNASDSRSNELGPYIGNHPRSPVAEAFRGLRANLEFAAVDKPLKTILITSAGPREGKTTVAVNLAAIFSQESKLAMLVDCDLRRPEIHKIFGYDNNIGLSSSLIDQSGVRDGAILWSKSLAVVPSGTLPPNPTELLGSSMMVDILRRFKNVSDVVVLDSPPSVVADAVILSAKVDGVVLVVRPGHTHSGAAIALVEQLRRADARVVGVVLNRISRKQLGYYGRYSYKYAPYYYSKDGHYSSGDGQDPGTQSRINGRSRILGRFRRRKS